MILVGYGGTLRFDPWRPDGTPRTSLEDGIKLTYQAYLKERD